MVLRLAPLPFLGCILLFCFIFDIYVLYRLFMEILNDCSDVDEIKFQEDGSWCPMRPKKEAMKVTSQPCTKVESSSVFSKALFSDCSQWCKQEEDWCYWSNNRELFWWRGRPSRQKEMHLYVRNTKQSNQRVCPEPGATHAVFLSLQSLHRQNMRVRQLVLCHGTTV